MNARRNRKCSEVMRAALAIGGGVCVTVAGGASPLLAQTANTLPPKRPIARQILPIVASLQHRAPGAVATILPIVRQPVKLPVPVGAGTTASAVQPASAAVKPVARTKVAAAAPPTQQSAAQPVAKPAGQPPAAVVAAPAAPAPTPSKYVAYTCKIGQDYSIERHECFTPGVTIAPGTPNKATPTVSRSTGTSAPDNPVQRSALGAKHKP